MNGEEELMWATTGTHLLVYLAALIFWNQGFADVVSMCEHNFTSLILIVNVCLYHNSSRTDRVTMSWIVSHDLLIAL